MSGEEGRSPRPIVGVGYRPEIGRQLRTGGQRFDALELTADAWLPSIQRRKEEIDWLRQQSDLIVHSLDLSIGSVAAPAPNYLAALAHLVEHTGARMLSDHLAVTRSERFDFGHLTPIHYNDASLGVAIRNVQLIQRAISVPISFETITETYPAVDSHWNQARFASELHQATGCGIHLDITNVFINACNHNFDAREFIDRLPPQAVDLVHIVGYSIDADGTYLDSHATSITNDLLDLLAYALQRSQPRYIILERDQNIPSHAELHAEVALIDRVIDCAATV